MGGYGYRSLRKDTWSARDVHIVRQWRVQLGHRVIVSGYCAHLSAGDNSWRVGV